MKSLKTFLTVGILISAITPMSIYARGIDDFLNDSLKPDPESFEVKWADTHFYLIGDFNNWQLPQADNLNGAIEFSGNGREINAELYLEPGNHEAAIYTTGYYHNDNPYFYLTSITSEAKKIKIIEGEVLYAQISDDGEFIGYGKMYKRLVHGNGMNIASELEDVNTVKIKEWVGGKVSFTLDNYFLITVWSDEAPRYEAPSEDGLMYAVLSINGSEPALIKDWVTLQFDYKTRLTAEGNSMTLFFTTEENVNPSPENIWGASAPADFGPDAISSPLSFTLCKGGHPIRINSDDWMDFSVNGDWSQDNLVIGMAPNTNPLVYAYVSRDGGEIEEIACTPDPDNDYSFDLELEGKDIEVRFGFQSDRNIRSFGLVPTCYPPYSSYTVDGDWTTARLEHGAIPVSASFEKHGKLSLHVNPYHRTLSYNAKESDPADVKATDGIAKDTSYRYYDLQGRPVEKPANGMYIQVSTDGTSRKIAF